MTRKFLISTLTIVSALILILPQGFCDPGSSVLLDAILQETEAEFRRIDAELKQAAWELGASGLTDDRARESLSRLCGKFNFAVDCTAVDPQGRMLTVEPPVFRIYEGKDISDQEQIKRISETRLPVMSDVFKAVEGFDAVDVEHPVSTRDGRHLGFVSLLFKPEKFLGDIVEPLVKGTPVYIWAMDKSGRILYDSEDKKEIGLNLFTADLYRPYPDLIRLGKLISAKPQGNGVYRFLEARGKAVRKNAAWTTVSLYGTEWRLVAFYIENHVPAGSDLNEADLEKKPKALPARNP